MSTLKKTKASIIKLIYQLMFDFDTIMRHNDILYWTSGGTTLGAIRHGGIIPWDDDADVCMKYSDRKKLLGLEKAFNKCGYFMTKTWFGYKICYKNRKFIKGTDYSFPNLDVFFMKRTDSGRWIPVYKRVRETWPKDYYYHHQLFPLQEHVFGEFLVKVPKETKKYLDRMYGKDWNKIAYREYDHFKEEAVEKVKVKLTDADRKPAKPIAVKQRRCLQFKT